MRKQKKPDINEEGDFIFRWKLGDIVAEKRTGRKAMQQFVRTILEELLDIVSLTHRGEDLKVDGFRFLNEAEINKIFSNK